MAPTRAELEAARDAVVPDLLGPNTRLLVVGINPGLWTAAVGAHFARPGNRFYPALHAAGITDHLIDAAAGMSDDDREHLLERGVGITNLVPRATARADELDTTELRLGADRLRSLVAAVRPAVVAVLGVTAYRTAFGVRRATTGRQPSGLLPDGWGDTELWVVPNPSGLNAHETTASLATAYAAAARAAGMLEP